MQMDHETNLVIKIISEDSNDSAHLAGELKQQLGEKSRVELATEESTDLPGRDIDAATVMQAVSLGLVSLQTVVILAQVLNKFKTKKAVHSIFIINTETTEKIRIYRNDSLKTVRKKVRRIVRRRTFFTRWLK
jgi:hypothetical protein